MELRGSLGMKLSGSRWEIIKEKKKRERTRPREKKK
jgi:hypothetical protein